MRQLVKDKFKSPYVGSTGQYLPGVTTVLGLLNKPALMPWAWKQGKLGIPLNKAKDHAIDVGNICHYLIECFVQEKEPTLDPLYTPEQVLLAYQMLEHFKEYWVKRKAVLLHSELQLIDDELGYGGTLDLVVRCVETDGDCGHWYQDELWDIKTAKDIWPEYWMQLAAYQQLYLKTQDVLLHAPKIILITKELKFVAAEITDYRLEVAWKGFEYLAKAYPFIKQIQSKD